MKFEPDFQKEYNNVYLSNKKALQPISYQSTMKSTTKKDTLSPFEQLPRIIQERIINMLDVDPRKLINANQSTISTILEELLVEDSKDSKDYDDYEDSKDSVESLSSEEEEEALFLINRIKELRKKNRERKHKHKLKQINTK